LVSISASRNVFLLTSIKVIVRIPHVGSLNKIGSKRQPNVYSGA
jgi:hypothetical protein